VRWQRRMAGKMWEKIKEIYAGAFLIVTAGWLLGHLIAIQVCGVVAIAEPNKWILWTEIGLASLILILAVERFIKDLRK